MQDNPHDEVIIRRAADDDYPAVHRIFWETAFTSEFDSPNDAAAYVYKYCSWYHENAAELVYVAADRSVLGYICGVLDTGAHHDLAELAEHIPLFSDLYDRYPSHLHINITASARGRGIGSQLVERFTEAVRASGSPGVHLVTGADASNANFYRRNGFTDEYTRHGARFMGRRTFNVLDSSGKTATCEHNFSYSTI